MSCCKCGRDVASQPVMRDNQTGLECCEACGTIVGGPTGFIKYVDSIKSKSMGHTTYNDPPKKGESIQTQDIHSPRNLKIILAFFLYVVAFVLVAWVCVLYLNTTALLTIMFAMLIVPTTLIIVVQHFKEKGKHSEIETKELGGVQRINGENAFSSSKDDKKTPRQGVQPQPDKGKTAESSDIKKLRELENSLRENNVPIERDYNELLERIADSRNKEAIAILQSTAKAAEEFVKKYTQAGLHKQPGAWILKANAEEIIGKTRSAIEKLNAEA